MATFDLTKLEEVNKFAKRSCPAWNDFRLSRRRNRNKYRDAALEYYNSDQHQKLVSEYKSGEYWLNTYPWPYKDPSFANWPEDGSKKGYNLISDQSGCVVKYATSYVAYKIFEEVGEWPQKTSSERLDAKRWVQFLSEAGYKELVDRPEDGHHYVGVKPDEGEWGVVVWFEKAIFDDDAAIVSTYSQKSFETRFVPFSDFTWVRIN